MCNHTPQKHSPHKWLWVAFLLGSIGTIFGIAIYRNRPLRQELKARARQLAKQFHRSREAIQENVQQIFGEVSDQLERNYLEVYSHFLTALDQLKSRAEANQKNVDTLIDEIVDHFSKAQHWTDKSARRFSNLLKSEWEKRLKDQDDQE